jgi:DNA-binding phage protein
MARRYPSPRSGVDRPDIIAVLPSGRCSSELQAAALASNLRMIQVGDTRMAWTHSLMWRVSVLVLPLNESAIPNHHPVHTGLRIIGVADARHGAADVLTGLRAGLYDVLLCDDTPAVWMQRLWNAIRDERNSDQRSFAEFLANTNEIPDRDTWNDLLVAEAIRRSDGNLAQAARMLGVSRQALHRRMSDRDRQSKLTDDSISSAERNA